MFVAVDGTDLWREGEPHDERLYIPGFDIGDMAQPPLPGDEILVPAAVLPFVVVLRVVRRRFEKRVVGPQIGWGCELACEAVDPEHVRGRLLERASAKRMRARKGAA